MLRGRGGLTMRATQIDSTMLYNDCSDPFSTDNWLLHLVGPVIPEVDFTSGGVASCAGANLHYFLTLAGH